VQHGVQCGGMCANCQNILPHQKFCNNTKRVSIEIQKATARSSIIHLIQKLDLTGSDCDNNEGMVGRHMSAWTQDNATYVCKALLWSPSRFVMRCSQSLNIKIMWTHSIKWQDFILYPFKIPVVQMLTEANEGWRCEFCQDFLQFMQQ